MNEPVRSSLRMLFSEGSAPHHRRYTVMTTLPLAWCPSMWATAFAA